MNGSGGEGERSLRIGEFARLAGVTVRTVRYYEELGLLGPGRDRRSGRGSDGERAGDAERCPPSCGAEHRRYTERDLLYLQRIQQLKSYDLTLGEIREITELAESDPSGEKRRVRLLARYREKLREAQARRARLDQYLQELEWHVAQLEEVGSFQDCPGKECARCRYTGICNFARMPPSAHPAAGVRTSPSARASARAAAAGGARPEGRPGTDRREAT